MSQALFVGTGELWNKNPGVSHHSKQNRKFAVGTTPPQVEKNSGLLSKQTGDLSNHDEITFFHWSFA
jgi:hypothetical protein